MAREDWPPGPPEIWAGIDAGKGYHWAVALDADGETVFSTKVINDEAQILALIDTAAGRADEVRWAVDISGRASTLLLALLAVHDQHVVYVPGRTVNRMSGAYRGEGKTDARDARVIADQARMRRKDFARLDTPPELVSALRILTNYRADFIADRVRLVNRLRDLLVGICPAAERAFDYSAAKGPVVMLTEYQTPAALRRIGVKRLTTWLERRKVRGAQTVAAKAVEAAQSQQITLSGEKRAAKLVCELAHQLLALDERIKDNDREIREAFRTDERAETIESMPGMGPIPGAEFVAIVGDLSGYQDAGTPGLSCRPGPGRPGLRAPYRELPQAQALQPASALAVLYVRPGLDDAARPLQGLLPQETGRRAVAQPSSAVPCPPPSRCPVGNPA